MRQDPELPSDSGGLIEVNGANGVNYLLAPLDIGPFDGDNGLTDPVRTELAKTELKALFRNYIAQGGETVVVIDGRGFAPSLNETCLPEAMDETGLRSIIQVRYNTDIPLFSFVLLTIAGGVAIPVGASLLYYERWLSQMETRGIDEPSSRREFLRRVLAISASVVVAGTEVKRESDTYSRDRVPQLLLSLGKQGKIKNGKCLVLMTETDIDISTLAQLLHQGLPQDANSDTGFGALVGPAEENKLLP